MQDKHCCCSSCCYYWRYCSGVHGACPKNFRSSTTGGKFRSAGDNPGLAAGGAHQHYQQQQMATWFFYWCLSVAVYESVKSVYAFRSFLSVFLSPYMVHMKISFLLPLLQFNTCSALVPSELFSELVAFLLASIAPLPRIS